MTFEEINKAIDSNITVHFAMNKYIVKRDLYGKLSIESSQTGNTLELDSDEYCECYTA